MLSNIDEHLADDTVATEKKLEKQLGRHKMEVGGTEKKENEAKAGRLQKQVNEEVKEQNNMLDHEHRIEKNSKSMIEMKMKKEQEKNPGERQKAYQQIWQNNEGREEQENYFKKELQEKQGGNKAELRQYDFRIVLTGQFSKLFTPKDLEEAILKLDVPPPDLLFIRKNDAFVSWYRADSKLTLAAFSGFAVGGVNLKVQLLDSCIPPNRAHRRCMIQKQILDNKIAESLLVSAESTESQTLRPTEKIIMGELEKPQEQVLQTQTKLEYVNEEGNKKSIAKEKKLNENKDKKEGQKKETEQENENIQKQQKEVQRQPCEKHDQEIELEQKRDSAGEDEFRIFISWIPKGFVKSKLDKELVKLNVPPVDAVHIGELKTKNLFAFFSWQNWDPKLTLAAFGDLKLPFNTQGSYVQLCDHKVPLPLDDSQILVGSPFKTKSKVNYGVVYGPNRIHLSTGIELKSKVQEHKYTQVATQIVSNKALALTKVNTSREKTLNGIVTEVEATKKM